MSLVNAWRLLVTYPHWERLSKLTLGAILRGLGTQDHFRMDDSSRIGAEPEVNADQRCVRPQFSNSSAPSVDVAVDEGDDPQPRRRWFGNFVCCQQDGPPGLCGWLLESR